MRKTAFVFLPLTGHICPFCQVILPPLKAQPSPAVRIQAQPPTDTCPTFPGSPPDVALPLAAARIWSSEGSLAVEAAL